MNKLLKSEDSKQILFTKEKDDFCKQVKDYNDLINVKDTTQLHTFSIHCSEANFTTVFTHQISCQYTQLVIGIFMQEVTVGLVFEMAGERKNKSLPQNS